MLKMPQAQKLEMLKAHKVKKKIKKNEESGKEWASHFSVVNGANANNPDTLSALKKFVVVLKESSPQFAKEFISELGLNFLCHLGSKLNIPFDVQLLLSFKGLIDTEGTVTSIINNELAILVIVQKIDSREQKVRELALQLLVSLVAVDTKYTIKAVNDIMSALVTQSNAFHQSRNRWKPLISHLNTSTVYDGWCVTLINYLLGSLASVEARTEERRILNSEQFDHILRDMEDNIEFKEDSKKKDELNEVYSQYALLSSQIDAYFTLLKQDFEITSDLNNPNALFKICLNQCIKDGYINQLTSILSNLITIPAKASSVWENIAKIVGQATLPSQKKMIETTNLPPNTLGTRVNDNKNKNKNNKNGNNNNREFHYPNFNALKLLLNVKEQQEEAKNEETIALQKDLETQRSKVLKLESEIKKLKKTIENGEFMKKTVNNGSAGGDSTVTTKPVNPVAAMLAKKMAEKQDNSLTGITKAIVNKDDGYNKYRKMLKMKV